MAGLGSFILSAGAISGMAYAWRLFGRRGPKLTTELKAFFGCDVEQLPIITRSFVTVDLPNLERAIEHYIEATAAPSRVLGYASAYGPFQNDLRTLLSQGAAASGAQYREVQIDVDQQMRCLENGLHLINGPEGRIAAHVRSDMMRGRLELEVMATSAERATRFIEQIRENITAANVFRGRVISLECESPIPGRFGFSQVRFHRFAPVRREDIILPEETILMLERNTVRFFANAEVLRRSGRSLKRGLLLHGKPGTGKTYTARWLAQSLEGVTTILVSGDQLGMVKECCQLARMLAPALVILEDVDLIAGERNEQRHPAYQVTLHQLLNEMDGLSSNMEVLFLLTTNRPEAIEPAIAARPGRIDQAIEFPLPDADCRRRLLHFYGKGISLALQDEEKLIDRTAGASPAFIQELVRKATLIAAEQEDAANGLLTITDACFDTALREMIYGGGELTRNLLGFPAPEEEKSAGTIPAQTGPEKGNSRTKGPRREQRPM